ncbi:MAG: oligosaccharide flippase family protein [Desulfotomaculaceae bacterium]|nr:oligosaccharide flippase family protein [Desulfotomaculaceae bacterium]
MIDFWGNFFEMRMQQITRRPFIRNVFTVASGTAVAQAVGMAFAPFITRLYGPEAFGLQGLFVSVVSLLSIIAALGYPTAIVLPKSDADALGLAKLSIAIGFLTALFTTVALVFFGVDLLKLLNAEAISSFLFLIPFAMVIWVLSSVLSQWLIRKKAYQLTSRFSVFTTLLLNSAKTAMGVLAPSALVLIVTNVAGSLIGTVLTFFGWKRFVKERGEEQEATAPPATFLQLATRHKDFPLLRTPQNLINAFSQNLPVLLLASYFGASASGQYTIALSVLALPANLIGASVMAVFYPRITEAIHNGENARSLIVRATIGMAVIGALPYLLVMVAGPFLFASIFGQEWRTAGVYAQWLSIWLFLQYINKPAVSAIPALRLQGGLLIYEFFSTVTKIFALWMGFSIYGNAVVSVALFSLFGIVAYVWLILWVVYRSGKLPAENAIG